MTKWLWQSALISISGLSIVGCGLIGRNNAEESIAIKPRWVRSTLASENYGFRLLHRMSPILTENMVIQGNAIDGLTAYDRKKGVQRWRLNIKNGVEGNAVLKDGILFFGAGDGFFYAVDSGTGKIKWTFPIRSEGLGEPLVLNNVVYFIAGNNVAYALDAESGKQLWLYNRRDPSILSIRGGSQPQLVGDILYLGFSDGYLVALKRDSGTLVWEKSLSTNKRFRDVDATPIIEGDRIYVSSYDGLLYALNRSDGVTLWSVDDGGYWPVTLTTDRIYYSTTSGKVMALDKSSGKTIWTYKLKKGAATRPVLFRNMVLVGESEGALRVFEAATGRLLTHFFPGHGLQSTPSVDPTSGEIYFISSSANLFALRLQWESLGDRWPWE